jgi:hypothetical protein
VEEFYCFGANDFSYSVHFFLLRAFSEIGLEVEGVGIGVDGNEGPGAEEVAAGWEVEGEERVEGVKESSSASGMVDSALRF